MRKKPHGQLVTSVALDRWVDRTSDPTSELVICAVYGPGKQPSCAASGIKPSTGGVDLSAGAAIREDALSAPGACRCQSAAAAAAVLLLLFLRRRLLFYFTSGLVSYWYDN